METSERVAGGDDADAAHDLARRRRPHEDVDGDLVRAHDRRTSRTKTSPPTSESAASVIGSAV